MQEDSCPIIGICIFVLIVLLAKYLSETTKDISDTYSWQAFSTPFTKAMFCLPSFLFATRIIRALTQFTITFIFVAVALSARGWGCLLILSLEVLGVRLARGSLLFAPCRGWPRERWVSELGSWFISEVLLLFQGLKASPTLMSLSLFEWICGETLVHTWRKVRWHHSQTRPTLNLSGEIILGL